MEGREKVIPLTSHAAETSRNEQVEGSEMLLTSDVLALSNSPGCFSVVTKN
jgi:hypothetical protein